LLALNPVRHQAASVSEVPKSALKTDELYFAGLKHVVYSSLTKDVNKRGKSHEVLRGKHQLLVKQQ